MNNTGSPPNKHIDYLMTQAGRLMKRQPDRAGTHFLIWLSLYSWKLGLPWFDRGENGVEMQEENPAG